MRMTEKSTGKINYVLALIVFVLTMLLINLGAMLLSFCVSAAGALIQGMDGVNRAYYFLFDNANLYTALVYLMVLAVFGLWYYFACVQQNGIRKYLRECTVRFSPLSFLWMILLAFAANHATTLLMSVVMMMAPDAAYDYTQMVEVSGMTNYSVLWAVSTLILPAVTEEIIFRGLILNYLQKAGACFFAANAIQAVGFGIYHQNLIQGIYAALMGFLMGYLAQRYKSLLAPVFMHFIYNLFGTALVEFESVFIPQAGQMLLIIQSIPLLVAALFLIQLRVGEKKEKKQEENIQ